MSATKDCPSCGSEAPPSARRCKSCFHDFDAPAPSGGGGLLFAAVAGLAALTGMVWVAALGLLWAAQQPVEQQVLVDQDSQSIVWAAAYSDGPRTRRVPFEQVASIEYSSTRGGTYRVTALTIDGGRHVIQEASGPMKAEADRYAEVTGKPLIESHDARGFGG